MGDSGKHHGNDKDLSHGARPQRDFAEVQANGKNMAVGGAGSQWENC
jgi:hypothetical protein